MNDQMRRMGRILLRRGFGGQVGLMLAAMGWAMSPALAANTNFPTVYFNLRTLASVASARGLTLTPEVNPVSDGTNIYWSPALQVTPTNGLAVVSNLVPNSYVITLSGTPGSWKLPVPWGTNGYVNAAWLTTNLMTYSALGVAPVYVTNVYYLTNVAGNAVTNGQAGVTLSDLTITGTGLFSSAGAVSGNEGDFNYGYVTGIWSAGQLVGDGSGVTNLDASQLKLGTIIAPAAPATKPVNLPYGRNWKNMTHPSVVDAGPGKWNGYRYWMAYTRSPYLGYSLGAGQDCEVLASNDKYNWELPMVGGVLATNPVIDDGALTTFTGSGNQCTASDPELFLINRGGGVTNLMMCFVRDPNGVDPVVLMGTESSNGVTWWKPGQVGSSAGMNIVWNPNPGINNMVSPEIVPEPDGSFTLFFGFNASLYKATASSSLAFSGVSSALLGNWWHGDVKKCNGTYYSVYNRTNAPQPSAVGLAHSADGSTWVEDSADALIRTGLKFDSGGFYKPEMLIITNNPLTVDLWVGTGVQYDTGAGTINGVVSRNPRDTIGFLLEASDYWQLGFWPEIVLPNTFNTFSNEAPTYVMTTVGANKRRLTRVNGDLSADYVHGDWMYLKKGIAPEPVLFGATGSEDNRFAITFDGGHWGFGVRTNIEAGWQFGTDVMIGTTNSGTGYVPFIMGYTINEAYCKVGRGGGTAQNFTFKDRDGGRMGLFKVYGSVTLDNIGITQIGANDGTHPTLEMYHAAGNVFEWDIGKGAYPDYSMILDIEGKGGPMAEFRLKAVEMTQTGKATFSGAVNVASNGVQTVNLLTNGSVIARGFMVPTNSATIPVDLSKGYADFSTNAAFAVSGFVNISATNYQSSVLLVTNTTGSAIVITPPANCHTNGTFLCTNVTALSFFCNAGRWTNVISMPLW